MMPGQVGHAYNFFLFGTPCKDIIIGCAGGVMVTNLIVNW